MQTPRIVCLQFRHLAELIATIRAWADGGKAEGDPKDLPPQPTFTDGWKIGKPDLVLSIPEHDLAATGPDEYTVPTGLTEDKWVVAAELPPGNRKVVHYVHVFIVESEDKKKPDTPAAAYTRWLLVKQGTLQFIRPDGPRDRRRLPERRQRSVSRQQTGSITQSHRLVSSGPRS